MEDLSKVPELRSLSTDLVNLKEEFFNDPTDTILDGVYAHQNSKNADGAKKTKLPPRPKKSTKEPDCVSKFLGFNIFGFWGIALILTAAIWIQVFRTNGFKPMKWKKLAKTQWECLADLPQGVQEIARPVVSCDVCSSIDTFPVVTQITKEEFMKKYAFTRVPVLIRGAAKNWTATNAFSFEFFRDLYKSFDGAFELQEDKAQFFPYKTEFSSLKEALLMKKLRREKPFYFGWSNEHPEVGKILRQHYEKPYFIPTNCESASTDWMFMGTPNKGAHMHLDYVGRPSWQAQIRGTKQWFLQPTAECQHVCKDINVTVTPGDILVVDTNQWFHSTFTHKGDISITIGSEYD